VASKAVISANELASVDSMVFVGAIELTSASVAAFDYVGINNNMLNAAIVLNINFFI